MIRNSNRSPATRVPWRGYFELTGRAARIYGDLHWKRWCTSGYLRRMLRRGHLLEHEALTQAMCRHWARSFFEDAHCRVEVEGRQHIPERGPLLVVCNHQSFLDIPLLFAYLGGEKGLSMRFLGRNTLRRIPGFSYWMRHQGSVGIEPGRVQATSRRYASLGQEIMAGRQGLVLFPEGSRTRSAQREPQPFRMGSLRMAYDHPALPVLPVTLDGTQRLSDPRFLQRTQGSKNKERLLRMQIDAPRSMGATNRQHARSLARALEAQLHANWLRIRVD